MKIKSVLSYLGVFLQISGLLSLLPIMVSIYYNEDFIPFLYSGVPAIIIGMLLARLLREKLSFGDAMVLSTLSLIVISLFGAFSFFITFEGSIGERLLNGYFESVSGYTTTGFTVLPREKLDPGSPHYHHGLIFKRSLIQWIGGLGVIILFLSILVGGGMSSVYLYKTGVGIQRVSPSVEHTARIMFRVCLFYTLGGAMLLYITGMDPFYALNAALTSISTGGFSYSVSGLHANLSGKFVITLLMLIGAIPFTLHYFMLGGDVKKFFQHIEVKMMFLIIVLFTVILTPVFYVIGMTITESFGYSVFNTISTLTTTGHSIKTSSEWDSMDDALKLAFITLMVIGAGAGSTGGALKLIRVAVLLSAIVWTIKKTLLPREAIVPLKIGKHPFEEDELLSISLFFCIYLILLVLGTIVLTVFGVSLTGQHNVKSIDALFVSASAQANAGPTTIDIVEQPIIVKIVLILQMIAGRLEIFPILALIGYVLGIAKKKSEAVSRI